MERNYTDGDHGDEYILERKRKIDTALSRAGLTYYTGGVVSGAVGSPSKSLDEMIRERDIESVGFEFDRALRNIESSPREAVSAACNLLEAVCKIYIEDEGLELPSKLDLQPVWTIVRKDLGIDTSRVEDRDLKEILSGLIATVNGIGALRTHASSAHGEGRKHYNLEPRHARLAVHGAHTVAVFILESWDKRRDLKDSD